MRDFNCIFDILTILAEYTEPVNYQEFYNHYYSIRSSRDRFYDVKSLADRDLFYCNTNLLCEVKAIIITGEPMEDDLTDRPHFDPDNYSSIEYADDDKTIAVKGYYEIPFYSLSWLGHNFKDFLSALKQQVSNDLNEINFYDSNLIATYGNTQVYKALF